MKLANNAVTINYANGVKSISKLDVEFKICGSQRQMVNPNSGMKFNFEAGSDFKSEVMWIFFPWG